MLSCVFVVATPTTPPPPKLCPVGWPEIAVNGSVVPEVGPGWLDPELPPELLVACWDASLVPGFELVPAFPVAVVSALDADAKLPFRLLTDCPSPCPPAIPAPASPALNCVITSARCKTLKSFPKGSL